MTTTSPSRSTGSDIELAVSGMTCASCANRIEKKLNKLDGITASVNYATEKASVTAPEGFDPQLLIAEVEKTGYTAAVPAPAAPTRAPALRPPEAGPGCLRATAAPSPPAFAARGKCCRPNRSRRYGRPR